MHGEGTDDEDAEVPMSAYEKQRLANIARNQKLMVELGLAGGITGQAKAKDAELLAKSAKTDDEMGEADGEVAPVTMSSEGTAEKAEVQDAKDAEGGGKAAALRSCDAL